MTLRSEFLTNNQRGVNKWKHYFHRLRVTFGAVHSTARARSRKSELAPVDRPNCSTRIWARTTDHIDRHQPSMQGSCRGRIRS